MNARVVLFFIMMLISCSPRASISSLQDDEPLNILIVNSWHLGMPWQNFVRKRLEIDAETVFNQAQYLY